MIRYRRPASQALVGTLAQVGVKPACFLAAGPAIPAEPLERAECSVLFLTSEPSILTPEPRRKKSAAKSHPIHEADAAVH
jgi:hypothetical protein